MTIQTVEERLATKTASYVAKNGKQPSDKLLESWKAQFTAEYESELEASQDDDDDDDDDAEFSDDDAAELIRMRAENAKLRATLESIKPSRGQFGLSPVTIWINDAKLSDVQIRTMLGLDSQTPITSKPQRDGSDRKMVKLGKSGQTLAKLQACMSLWSTQKLDIK